MLKVESSKPPGKKPRQNQILKRSKDSETELGPVPPPVPEPKIPKK